MQDAFTLPINVYAVITAVPGATAVTLPSASTTATLSSLLSHLMREYPFLGAKEYVSLPDTPSSRFILPAERAILVGASTIVTVIFLATPALEVTVRVYLPVLVPFILRPLTLR